MKRIKLFFIFVSLFFLFHSSVTFAAWSFYTSGADAGATLSNLTSTYPTAAYKVTCTTTKCYGYYWHPIDTTVTDMEGDIYNYPFTDEQCKSKYGENFFSTGDVNTAYSPSAACTDVALSSPADEQCKSITAGTANFLTMPYNPGGVFEWVSGGCKYKTSAVWLETTTGEYSAKYEAVEAVDDGAPVEDIESEPVMPSNGQDSTSDYTETTNPDADCYMNNFSYEGATYCYTPTKKSEIDWSDTPEVGSGGSSSSDGSPLGQGGGDPDGDGVGDSTNGDIVGALDDLGDLIRNGFDGLLDGLTEDVGSADSYVNKTGIDGGMGQFDEAQDGVEDAFGEAMSGSGSGQGLGEGSSSPWADPIAGAIPTQFGGGCSDLVFTALGHSMVISCKAANTVKKWIEWVLYFWTTVAIANLFLARRAA